VVLELLEGDKTLNEIASKYGVLPRSLINWKMRPLPILCKSPLKISLYINLSNKPIKPIFKYY